MCQMYNDDDACVIKKVGNHVKRGCKSNMTECDIGEENCYKCNGSGCNKLDSSHENVPSFPSKYFHTI